MMGYNTLIIDTKWNRVVYFEKKFLGMMHYLLGMEVEKSADGIFL